MSYHTKHIPKGVVGEFSKIEELKDAVEQQDKVLTICELTDLVGAIQLFAASKFNLSMEDKVQEYFTFRYLLDELSDDLQ